MFEIKENGERLVLNSPTDLPKASSFLWNKTMMIHMNCRGYAVAQFMQPEPAKYSHAPNLEAKTFMQPEQPYYAHHPGRFIYIKDEETGELFSAPYEPVRSKHDSFSFSAGKNDIRWNVEKNGILVELCLSLPVEEPIELWSVKIINNSQKERMLSIYPYFPVGYMSWMNQSGEYVENLGGIVCSSITPYQKYQDYYKIKELKDKTFFLPDTEPYSWEVNQQVFEGEGGLHNPSGIQLEKLNRGDARYETPVCALQYKIALAPAEDKNYRFLFGPAKDEEEISAIKKHYFSDKNQAGLDGFEQTRLAYESYIKEGLGCFKIETPDAEFDNFVNHWLPRQVFYHGETNRLCTDPQTRNYLQDNMGMGYIKPEVTRNAFITALSQQEESGAMPDGILIHKDAELKYINQVPHTDHCVWLPVCLQAYLDETNDYALLDVQLGFKNSDKQASVAEHMNLAMDWLIKNRDERGLNYINQGDWCDPMNMVGYQGRGVSGWLSMGVSYALQVWAILSKNYNNKVKLDYFEEKAKEINSAINTHLWDGEWYARGITDNNVKFGIKSDKEGSMFLNPQGWALLSKCTDEDKEKLILNAVDQNLESPYGVEMLAPSFTKMREDVGRVTQKFPGSAENGSVYNHATAFYIYALYQIGEYDRAYRLIRKMIPSTSSEDIIRRGQLPVFIPNYYRGAYKQFPEKAGFSSQLFNTGTSHWVYRCLIDGLIGLRGTPIGLQISPKLPSTWNEIKITREFRGAVFHVEVKKLAGIERMEIEVNGKLLDGTVVENIEAGKSYKVCIKMPMH